MCKRIASLVLCCVMFCVCFTVSASAEEKVTNRRGAFEFVELYMNRLTALNHGNSFSKDIWISGNTIWPGSARDGFASVDTELGLIDVDLSDFSLDRVEFAIYDEADSEEERLARSYRFIAAVSALEYSYDEAARLRIGSQVVSGPKNEFEAANATAVEIMQNVRSAVADGTLQDGEVSVYSGNYEYSVYTMTYPMKDDVHTSYELIASARK